MTERKFVIPYDDFVKCMGEGAIGIESFSNSLGDELRKLSEGAFVVALDEYEHIPSKKFFLTMWKCRGDNVNCLVANNELAGFRSKLESVVKSSD